MGINSKLQLYERMCFIDFQLRFCNGIIDSVMDVKCGYILIANTAAASIAFICKDQSGGKCADRNTGPFIMITDSGYDLPNLIWRKAKMIQNPKSHDCSGLAVL